MDVVVVAISSLSTSPLVIVLFNINLGLVTILGISKGALACLVARPDGILQVGSSTPVLHKKSLICSHIQSMVKCPAYLIGRRATMYGWG